MSTAVTDVQAEAPCEHLNRTPSSNPNREVCDECKQIFQDGVPLPKIGQQLSDLAPEAEVLPVTKAAASRAKKARKPKVGKAVGALTIPLNAEELARGKHEDEETARKKYIESVNKDAAIIVSTMTGFAALCKTADEAIEARDEYFSRKFKNPDFAKRVQNIRDFASTKRNNEVLTIDGREYTSVKDFFKAELGVTYEYIRQLGEKGKLGACNRLFTDSKPKAMGTETEINVPQEETPDLPEIPDAETPIQPATQETPTPQQPDILSLSLDERVRHAVNDVLPYTKTLSPAEANDFVVQLYDRLMSELGFIVYSVQPTTETESATA